MKKLALACTLMTLAACGGRAETTHDGSQPNGQNAGAGGAGAGGANDPPASQPPAPAAVETIVTNQTQPTRLGVGGGNVFFSTTSPSDVYRWDLASKRRATIGPSVSTQRFVVDDAGLFFSGQFDIEGGTTEISGSDVPGCSLEECDGWMPQWRTYVQGTVQAIGLDATNVYAVAELPGYHYVLSRTARAMAPRGQVAAPTPTELTRWDDASATAIYVDDREIVLGGDIGIAAVDKASGHLRVVSTVGSGSFAVDGAFVYWHDTSKGALMRVARSGGRVETFATTSTPYSAVALAMGASSVYVLRSGQLTQDGSIVAIDKTSGAKRTVIDGLGAIGGAVVAGSHLYWSNPNQGTIQRVGDR